MKPRTRLATTLSTAALLAGGVVAAGPAHALTSHTVTTSTLSSCQQQLRYVVKDLQSSRQYHQERCGKRETNNHGGCVYQGTVWYYG